MTTSARVSSSTRRTPAPRTSGETGKTAAEKPSTKGRSAPAQTSKSKRGTAKTNAPTKSATARKPGFAAQPKPASRAIVATPASAQSPHFTEQLRDGTHVIIRPLRKSDAALERAFIKRLSPESRRLRFLGQVSEPSDDMIRRLTDIDYRKDMAFVALVHRDNEKREVGVSRYSASADGQSCECAVTVDDEWHKKGLGSLLMRHLIDVARTRGIRTMMSFDDANNWQMRDLAAYLGFDRKRDPNDSTQVIHRLTL